MNSIISTNARVGLLKAGHTAEPWNIAEDGGRYPIRIISAEKTWKDFDYTRVCQIDLTSDGATDFRTCIADAERIVACVNALAGVEDPAAFVAAARLVMMRNAPKF